MKRIISGLLIGVLAIGIGAVWFEIHSMKKLQNVRLEIEALAEAARLSNKEAGDNFRFDQADLQVVVNRKVIETILTSLAGFEAVTKKGHRIKINNLTPSFREGFIFMEADAEFSAFYYKGPVKATYYAFVRLLDDGTCRLAFRISGAKPANQGLLSGAWLESLIVAKMQSKLKLPELDLPLGIVQDLEIPAVDKMVQDGQIRVRLPRRKVQLRVTGPQVLVTRDYLGFYADKIKLDTGDTPPNPATEGDGPVTSAMRQEEEIPTGIRVSLRFSLLTEIMDHLTAPQQDIQIEAEHIRKVWEKQSKILGLKVNSRADLVDVVGYLDVTRAALRLEGQSLHLDLEARGQIDGGLKGKAYGLTLDRPFTVYPTLDDSLPIQIIYGESSLTLQPEPKDLDLVMQIETELVGHKVRFHHSIGFAAEELIQPVVIPHRFQKEVLVPTRLESKAVVATRPVPFKFRWQLNLPENSDGYLVFTGDLFQ